MDAGRVVVVGSFNVDHVWRCQALPQPGETVSGTYATGPGGKGFNQAIAARRAGAPVSVVGRLGSDSFGEQFRVVLADEGIDDRHVVTHPTHGTGVAIPVVEPSG